VHYAEKRSEMRKESVREDHVMTTVEEIQKLKKEKNAVILAHYYVWPEVQEIADYIGDSFYLSKVATKLQEKTIVFCGVSFMGESAKILNPEKTVLMPDMTADCPMAHMADVETIRKMRKEYDDLAVVCYINSTAALKEYSDVCVTSANAVKIVKELPNKNIFFIPDRNLAHFVADHVPEKNFVYNNGFCPTHERMEPEDVTEVKRRHPGAQIVAHGECRAERCAPFAGYMRDGYGRGERTNPCRAYKPGYSAPAHRHQCGGCYRIRSGGYHASPGWGYCYPGLRS